MKKLLVGSVFAPSDRNATWRDLQQRFLSETLGPTNFDYVAWLNRVRPELFEGTGAVVKGDWESVSRGQVDDHLVGLSGLLEYFREMRHRYEHFLILDSDAFPFRANWLEKLLWMMQGRTWTGWVGATPTSEQLPERRVAAIVQVENMDVYFHPSTVFIKGDALRDDESCVEFRIEPLRNIMGFDFRDLALASKVPVMPLVRSNVWNVHPTLAGVYGDLIYHHGGDTDHIYTRSVQAGCFDHYIPRAAHDRLQADVYAAISKTPDVFLDHLTGAGRFDMR
jgi:hypothetical protein